MGGQWLCSVAKLCLILCSPMDCSPWAHSVHGISRAGILAQVAISFSKLIIFFLLKFPNTVIFKFLTYFSVICSFFFKWVLSFHTSTQYSFIDSLFSDIICNFLTVSLSSVELFVCESQMLWIVEETPWDKFCVWLCCGFMALTSIAFILILLSIEGFQAS